MHLAFFVLGAFAALFAELVQFQLVFFLFAADLIVILVFAFRAGQRNGDSFSCHLIFLDN